MGEVVDTSESSFTAELVVLRRKKARRLRARDGRVIRLPRARRRCRLTVVSAVRHSVSKRWERCVGGLSDPVVSISFGGSGARRFLCCGVRPWVDSMGERRNEELVRSNSGGQTTAGRSHWVSNYSTTIILSRPAAAPQSTSSLFVIPPRTKTGVVFCLRLVLLLLGRLRGSGAGLRSLAEKLLSWSCALITLRNSRNGPAWAERNERRLHHQCGDRRRFQDSTHAHRQPARRDRE